MSQQSFLAALPLPMQDGTSSTLDACLSAAHAQAQSQLSGFGLFDRRAARAQQAHLLQGFPHKRARRLSV